MAAFMRPLETQTYALLRIVTGFLFLWHGASKLLGFPTPPPPGPPASVLWVGGSIELFGGALVLIGLFTRWAAFLASGMMAFAYWMQKRPLRSVNWPERYTAPEGAVTACARSLARMLDSHD